LALFQEDQKWIGIAAGISKDPVKAMDIILMEKHNRLMDLDQ
jgi:hypothetical protein